MNKKRWIVVALALSAVLLVAFDRIGSWTTVATMHATTNFVAVVVGDHLDSQYRKISPSNLVAVQNTVLLPRTNLAGLYVQGTSATPGQMSLYETNGTFAQIFKAPDALTNNFTFIFPTNHPPAGRTNLAVKSVSGTTITLDWVGDNAAAAGGLTVKTNGVTLGTESTLNIVAGANTTITGLTGTGSNQVTIAATASGGNAGLMPAMRSGTEQFDDLFHLTPSTGIGLGVFGVAKAISGGNLTPLSSTTETNAYGVMQISTGTGATGYGGIADGGGSRNFWPGTYTNEWRVRLNSTNSSSDLHSVRLGYYDSSTGNNGADGCFFQTQTNEAGVWQAVTCNNSAFLTNNFTLSAGATNTAIWMTYRVVVKAEPGVATNAIFTITTTNAAFSMSESVTNTSNIPFTRGTGLQAFIVKFAGTTSATADIDYIYEGWSRVTPRQ